MKILFYYLQGKKINKEKILRSFTLDTQAVMASAIEHVTEEPAVFVVAYLPISVRRPALHFLYGLRFCLTPLIAFWTF